MSDEKRRSSRPVVRLLGYIRPYRWQVAFGLVSLILAIPMGQFHPLVWMFVIDEVILAEEPRFIELVGGRGQLLLAAIGIMFAVQMLGAGLSALRTYVLGRVGQQFVFHLRNDLYSHMQAQSLRFFHDRRSGDLVSRLIGDIDTLQTVIINGIDRILANGLQLIAVAGIIIWINWKLGLMTLAPMLIVGVMVGVFNHRVRGLYRRIRDRLGDVSAKVQENLMVMLIIKAFAREAFEQRRFEEENQRYLNEGMQGVLVRSVYFPAVQIVGFLSNVIMLGVGALFVLQGSFSVGGLVAYRGYWWQLFSPVNALAQINDMVQRAGAASTRIFELLDEKPEVKDRPEAIPLKEVHGRIAFEDVFFGYNPDLLILRGLSFQADPGEKIGLVGPSGAGKSTLLTLVLRFYDPVRGSVRLDGHDLRELEQATFREHFAIVSQEPFLFNETVRENIRFGRLEATDAEIDQAARLANAHEFILSLPEGYDTRVGERGVKLSGGQKQRICIARAFLANPRVLLLDEATAAVEPESEAIIQGALERLMEGRTTLIVSHRLSVVRDCDQILVIQDGQIAEQGRHDALLDAEGWYARMYRMQMEGVGSPWTEAAGDTLSTGEKMEG